MIIIRSRLVPRNFCVNLFGTIWTRDASWIDKYVVNHERIHSAQQRELLWIPFYVFYIVEYLFRLLVERNPMKAYRKVSHEREAYQNDHNLAYLKHRKHYAMWRHRQKIG